MVVRQGGLDPAAIRRLRKLVSGEVIEPGDPDFESARRVWNGMIDRFPAIVVRPRSNADVAAAIGAARELGLEIAVRGGGHNIAGASTVDDGLVIDLSLMRAATVDSVRRRATVQGGALLRDLDAATSAVDLVAPAGMVSHTGVAGLTLGGGYGFLSRLYGLACDNLVAAEVVLADGSVVRASETDGSDLLWGLRGAGANFGVVTSLEFRLHPLPPLLETGDLFFGIDEAPTAIRAALDVAAEAPDRLLILAYTASGRADHNIPEDRFGRQIAAVFWTYAGDRAEGERLVAPILAAARPIKEISKSLPYVELQQAADDNMHHEQRVYWKSSYLPQLTDQAIGAFLSRGTSDGQIVPSAELILMGGAPSRVGEDDTAFSQRGALFDYLAMWTWENPAEDERCIQDVRRAWGAMSPYAIEAAYVNNLGEEGADRVRSAYGEAKYARLQRLKDHYDPNNTFHRNANVRPSLSPPGA